MIVPLVGDLAEVVEDLVVRDQLVRARELHLRRGKVAVLVELDAATKATLRLGQLRVVGVARRRLRERFHGRLRLCVRSARAAGDRGQRERQDRLGFHLKGSASSMVRSEAGRLVSRLASSNGWVWPRVSEPRRVDSSRSSRRAACARRANRVFVAAEAGSVDGSASAATAGAGESAGAVASVGRIVGAGAGSRSVGLRCGRRAASRPNTRAAGSGATSARTSAAAATGAGRGRRWRRAQRGLREDEADDCGDRRHADDRAAQADARFGVGFGRRQRRHQPAARHDPASANTFASSTTVTSSTSSASDRK